MSATLSMQNITKRFPGVLANDQVNFNVERGEIHALIGENGAGKTTLMNILYGLYQADAGQIHFRSKQVEIESPRHAIALGIGMVHQHFMLIPVFTVAENIALGLKSSKGIILDTEQVSGRIRQLSEQYGLRVDPDIEVWRLPVGVQQRVEILKALYREADLLILDEPTAILTPQETGELFSILRSLAAHGHSIIFISHKLNEVVEISDRITVLRRGQVISTIATSDATIPKLAEMMVGREVSFTVDKKSAQTGEAVLKIRDLTAIDHRGLKVLKGISLDLSTGEIVGIAGVEGNGQRELADALAGLRSVSAGEIWLGGKNVTNVSPDEVIKAGLSYIPEDRNQMGSIGRFTLAENGILKSHNQRPFAHRLLLKSAAIANHARELVARYDIRTPGINVQVRTLSGGNLQKLILAREVSRRTPVLVAVQPTRGVDLATMKFIHRQLLELRDAGIGILLISTELDEIFSLSDRIAVMYEGQILDIMPAERANREEIGLLMAGMRHHTTSDKHKSQNKVISAGDKSMEVVD